MEPYEELLVSVDDKVAKALEAPEQEAEARLAEIIDKLELMAKSHPHDGALAYAIGYCWYNVPSGSTPRSTEAARWLHRAVLIDADNYYAWLYLGHLAFDEGRYSDASEYFIKIPSGHFSELGQSWRDVKLRELIVCCDIYEKRSAVSQDLKSILSAYSGVSIEDRPLPKELMNTLLWVRREQTSQLTTAVYELIVKILELADARDIFEEHMRELAEGVVSRDY